MTLVGNIVHLWKPPRHNERVQRVNLSMPWRQFKPILSCVPPCGINMFSVSCTGYYFTTKGKSRFSRYLKMQPEVIHLFIMMLTRLTARCRFFRHRLPKETSLKLSMSLAVPLPGHSDRQERNVLKRLKLAASRYQGRHRFCQQTHPVPKAPATDYQSFGRH